MHGESLFVKVYWLALVVYLLIMWVAIPRLRHLPGMPDYQLKDVGAKYRWLAFHLHLLVAFMPLLNIVLLCFTVIVICKCTWKSYLLKQEKLRELYPEP